MLRIAFVGTSGVGKTTMAEELLFRLNEAGLGCERIAERSRTIIKQFGHTSPKEITDEMEMKAFQTAISASQSALEMELGEKGKSFISDRCYADYASYARLFVSDGAWLQSYTRLQFALFALSQYDAVFYIPPAIAAVDDGVRYSATIRDQVDEIVKSVLRDWYRLPPQIDPADWTLNSASLCTITETDRDRRIEQALDLLVARAKTAEDRKACALASYGFASFKPSGC